LFADKPPPHFSSMSRKVLYLIFEKTLFAYSLVILWTILKLEPVRIPKYECILIMMGLVLFPPVQMQITGRIDRTTVHPHSDVGRLLAVAFDASSSSATASSHIFS